MSCLYVKAYIADMIKIKTPLTKVKVAWYSREEWEVVRGASKSDRKVNAKKIVPVTAGAICW